MFLEVWLDRRLACCTGNMMILMVKGSYPACVGAVRKWRKILEFFHFQILIKMALPTTSVL
jgi:hypothetical protein